MKIKNHRVLDIEYISTRKIGGIIKPDTIIIHYTATPTFNSAKNALLGDMNVSAHFLMDWDGTLLQMVDCNVKAWHSGRSKYKGRKHFNNYSIGIEIVNPGYLVKLGNKYKDVYGNIYNESKVIRARHRNNTTTRIYWHSYTEKQINTTIELCKVLKEEYNIEHILGHEEIAVGRKSDPGPAFPLDEIREIIFGKSEDIQGWVYGKLLALDNSDNKYDAIVNTENLNLRKSVKGDIIKVLPQNTELLILGKCGDWYNVEVL